MPGAEIIRMPHAGSVIMTRRGDMSIGECTFGMTDQTAARRTKHDRIVRLTYAAR